MGSNDLIHLELKGRVAIVTMQSQPVNAISEPWIKVFHAVLDRIETEPGLSVMHLRSSLKVFAAGGDLKEMKMRMEASDPAADMFDRLGRVHALFDRIERLPLISFCEIGGDMLGGGLELAVACDLRMAADSVRIGSPEIRLGLIPAAGGCQRITRLCGPAVAAQIIYLGERFDAATAQRWNLIHWCVPASELADRAREKIEQLASHSPEALRAAKACIAARANGHPDGFALERELGSKLIVTDQTRAQVLAFLSRQS